MGATLPENFHPLSETCSDFSLSTGPRGQLPSLLVGSDQQAKTCSSPFHPKQSLPGLLSPSVSRSIKCGPIPVPTTGRRMGVGYVGMPGTAFPGGSG